MHDLAKSTQLNEHTSLSSNIGPSSDSVIDANVLSMRKVDDKTNAHRKMSKDIKTRITLQVNAYFEHVQKRIDTCSRNATVKDKIIHDSLKTLNSNKDISL